MNFCIGSITLSIGNCLSFISYSSPWTISWDQIAYFFAICQYLHGKSVTDPIGYRGYSGSFGRVDSKSLSTPFFPGAGDRDRQSCALQVDEVRFPGRREYSARKFAFEADILCEFVI